MLRLLSSRALERVRGLPEVWPRSMPLGILLGRTLDVLICLYGLAVLAILLTGGLDLGLVSLHDASKPALALFLAIPLRLTLPAPSWLTVGGERAASAAARVWSRAALRRPPAAVLDVAFALVVTRAFTFTIGFVANLLFPPARVRGVEMPFAPEKFAEIFVAWDSGWYFDIARRGYYYSADGQSSVAFFPLYPMLMRAVAWPFGGTDRAVWAAGIVVSFVGFALGLLVLHRLTERCLGTREAARRTVLYVAVFPFSLFMTRVYAESVFLLTSVLAVSSAFDRRWWRAGAWGALATLARPNGILVGVPLVLLALSDRPSPRELATRAAALLPVPGALAGFCGFVYMRSGEPLGWLSAQGQWGYFLWNPPWQQLLKLLGRIEKYGLYDYFFVSPMAPFHLFNGLAALVFLALTPAVFKRLGSAMGAYVLVSLLVPLSSNSLVGVGRYTAVLFPVFMLLGSLTSPRVHEAILIGGSLLLALFVTFFVTLQPIY
jgi:hypothetical protein